MNLPRRLRHGQAAELVEHLDELRKRLVVCLVALAAGTAVTFTFHGRLLSWLTAPLPPERRHLVTFGVAEPFTTSFKVSLYAGFALALPVVLWQVWNFLAPAFAERAQQTTARFIVFASALFAGGVAFGYAVALPAALRFLTNYDSSVYNIQIRAADYYSFAMIVLIAVGIVFELPVFILGLVRLGITSSARLRRNRRLGYVAMAALAVALPGVDPVTTAIEMVPLMVLFEGSIWVSALCEKRWGLVTAPSGAVT